MSRKLNSFPCICSHTYAQHEWIAYNGVCWYAKPMKDRGGRKYSCPCANYIPDNLKFLENQYEQNNIR